MSIKPTQPKQKRRRKQEEVSIRRMCVCVCTFFERCEEEPLTTGWYSLIKWVMSMGSSAASRKNIRIPASNSPQPVSVTSYGGTTTSRTGMAKLGCRLKTTLSTNADRSSPLGPRTKSVHSCVARSSGPFLSSSA